MSSDRVVWSRKERQAMSKVLLGLLLRAILGAIDGASVGFYSTGGPMSVFANGQFSRDGKQFTALVGLGMDGKPARFEYLHPFPDANSRTETPKGRFRCAGRRRDQGSAGPPTRTGEDLGDSERGARDDSPLPAEPRAGPG
jgi:hypothetical protein